MLKRRGYQGKRYRVFDLQNECYFDHSSDEVQALVWHYEKQKMQEVDFDENERRGDYDVSEVR